MMRFSGFLLLTHSFNKLSLFKNSFLPMNRIRSVVTLFTLLVLGYSGCDKGLEPEPSGFSGVIRFRNWPPLDSVDIVVQELRLVAFKNPPIDTTGLLIEFLKGNVVIYPPVGTTAFSKRDSIGHLRDSIHYTILFTLPVDEPPITYSYIAMAWRYGSNPFADWRPAGLYTTQPNTFNPGSITISKHVFIPNVDIDCDFHNPPPRPWR